MAQLTQQQHEAVYRRDVSVVLSSGAGCGKTHVLTQRYLAHLERDGAEVGQVVAITFTDRAARQMRQRIRKAVRLHLEAATSDDDVRRWEQHLRGLETAQISTIHAFCANLLRQHAVEAGLDPRFDVLEDFLAVNLESEALTACLQGLLTSDLQAGADLRELVLLYGWKPAVEAVRHLMRDRDAAAQTTWLTQRPDDVAAEWQRYARAELLPRYLNYLVAASPKVARCLWLLRTTPCSGPKMAGNVRRLLEQVPRLGEAEDLAAAVKELTEAAKVTGTERDKAWPSAEIYETVKKALEGFRGELPARLELFTEEADDLRAAVEVGQRFVRVAEEAAGAYRHLKRKSGVVDFQDLLVMARDLLRDRPEIRDRLQRRFRFLLIDELQDTDPVQMELVEHLAGLGLTEGKLFAVGDSKQSIYKFRGANVHLFQQLRRRVPHEGRLNLTLNFRSQPAILDFTNALCGPAAAAGTGLQDYEPLQPYHAQLNPSPCVEFLWSPREDGDNVSAARACEADWIARRIAGMIGRESLVAEERDGVRSPRPVRAGDVVLLFRAMTNVELYENALRRHGLDYYLVGGRAFFAQQEIYDLLNLLRALENPQDTVSLAGTLRSPFCCLSDEALFLLTRHPEGPWAGLHDDAVFARLPAEQRPRAERARHNLDRWRGLKNRLPIARLLGQVFADSAYDAAVQFEFLGDRKLANLWKLTDMARSFDRSGLFGLAEFIARLGDLVRTQPREEQAATQPENADVVRLMTIHQAKGLEFPVVVVPDLAAAGGGPVRPAAHWDARLGCVARPPADDPPPFTNFGWKLYEAGEAVEDWREDLRTLYVACTRAQDYLILSAALPANFSPQSAWMLLLAERFDLKTGRCLNAAMPPERVPQVRVTDLFTPPPEEAGEGRSEQNTRPSIVPKTAPASGGVYPRRPERDPARRDKPGGSPHANLLPGELLPSAAAPLQWDAEDGSDRAAWVRPAERVEASGTPRDRIVRTVLEAWDFRDANGWQSLLARAVQAQPGPEAAAQFRGELAALLGGFAQSEVRQELAKARACHREVEFLVPLADDASNREGPAVRGLIDCLWQDEAGDWHLLAYVTEDVPAAVRPRDWQRRRPALVLAALAARQQLGVWPRTVGCCYLQDGATVRRDGSRLQHRQVLRVMREALAGLT